MHHLESSDDLILPLGCGFADEDACPVRLSLAQMLDPSTPSATSIAHPAVEDPSARTIAITTALSDELPLKGDPSSSAAKHGHCGTKAISLHAAVAPSLPLERCISERSSKSCLAPQRLCLAEHIVSEDPCEVKEDFLATPLPFVGVAV